jgi:hypothetical protein
MASMEGLMKDLFASLDKEAQETIEAHGRITDNVCMNVKFYEFKLFTCEGNILSDVIMHQTPIGTYTQPMHTEEDEEIAEAFMKGFQEELSAGPGGQ